MEVLAQIGGSAYALVALVIGLRLVLLFRRTRELPELLVGVSMLFLAGIGYPLSAVAREATEMSVSASSWLNACSSSICASLQRCGR